jgi:hypothetical protein
VNPDDVERLLGSPLTPSQRDLITALDAGQPVVMDTSRRAGRAAVNKALEEGWQTIGYTRGEVGFLPSETTSETRETVTSNLTAYLIRSTTPDLDLSQRWAQTLILPLAVPDDITGEAAAVYTRTTNGSKGRGNSWTQEGPDENVLDKIADHRVVGKVGLTLSDAEAEALANNDIKALATRIAHQPLTANSLPIADLLNDLRAECWAQIVKAREADEATSLTLAQEQEAAAKAEEEKAAKVAQHVAAAETLRPVYPPEPDVYTEAPHVHVVAVEVPSGPGVDGYVQRNITSNPVMTDFDVFDLAAKEHLNVLLVGDTGAGKTMSVRAWAAEHNRPCYVIPGNGPLDPSALFGRFIPDPLSGTFEWVDGPVTTILRLGGVLVIDEINMILAKVLSVLYPVLDGRREVPLLDHSGEVVHAHEDVMIFATQNEGAGYSGTMPLSHAIKNRFMILRWGYDPAVEKQLITSPTLLTFASRIRDMHHAGDVETPTTTNSLMTFERLARATGNLALAIEVTLNRYAEGTERSGVKVVFEGLKANIEQELHPKQSRAADEPVRRASPRLRIKQEDALRAPVDAWVSTAQPDIVTF